MAAETLALGQAGYSLAPITPAESGTAVSVNQRGTAASRVFDVRSKAPNLQTSIDNLGIGVNFSGSTSTDATTVNVFDATNGLTASLGDGRDVLNLFRNADSAIIEMDAGNSVGDGADLLNVNGNSSLTDSTVRMGGGNDTVRIGGTASGSSFFLEDGSDQLTVTGASEGLYVDGGAGSDLLSFVGIQANATILGGDGSDSISFTQGFASVFPGSSFVGAGEGNDTIVFGVNSQSSGFGLSTGAGNDVVQLAGDVLEGSLWLGGDEPNAATVGADSISMTKGSFVSSSIASDNTGGDVLVFGANTTIANSSFAMGSGSDSLVFGGTLVGYADNSFIQLGAGADTLVFGSTSSVNGYSVDLGSDANADIVRLLGSYDTAQGGLVITGAGDQDILFIGSVEYNYSSSSDYWANSVNPSDTVRFA